MDFTESRLSTRAVFDGKLLHVREDEVRLPDGKTAVREWMDHRGAAVIVAFDEEDRLLLVRQYRYPLQGELLELPAGKLDPGETPEQGAARELAEETGYAAGRLTLLGRLAPAAAYTSEVLYVYLAEELTLCGQHLDEDEFLAVERWRLEDALALLDEDELIDAKTQIGLLRYLRLQDQKRTNC